MPEELEPAGIVRRRNAAEECGGGTRRPVAVQAADETGLAELRLDRETSIAGESGLRDN